MTMKIALLDPFYIKGHIVKTRRNSKIYLINRHKHIQTTKVKRQRNSSPKKGQDKMQEN